MKNRFILLLLGSFLFSCTDKFLEINTNPNNPEDVPSINILTWVQREYCNQMGGVWLNYNESSSMSGHVTKIAYIDETRYQIRPGTVSSMFDYPYSRFGANLNKIIEKESEAGGNRNMIAVAMIFKAMVFQVLTDHLGDVPYSEAFKSGEGILFPKYDAQKDIYADLIKQVQDAVAMIDVSSRIGSGDMLFGGDMAKWKKFGNSLLLRMAIRLSYVETSVAQSIISGLLSNPANVMENNSDNCIFNWPGAPYSEPLAAAEVSRKDYGMADVIVTVLKELEDPRLPVYAAPAPSPDAENGIYKGMPIGISRAMSGMAEYGPNTISPVGARYRNTQSPYSGITVLMRYSEVEFIKAEAYERGLASGDAMAAYERGIKASIEENGANGANEYLLQDMVDYNNAELPMLWWASEEGTRSVPELNSCANPTVADNVKLQKIAYQKWIALFTQGPEAWAEMRRTDIPVIGPAIGRTTVEKDHNRAPFRFPYAINTEKDYNPEHFKAALAKTEDYYWGEKMYWDVRVGVQ